MTDLRLNESEPTEDIDEVLTTYRRLAAMDPPALRALAGDLKRMSDESFAAAWQAGPAAQARARRNAHRAAAARAALASVETEGPVGESI